MTFGAQHADTTEDLRRSLQSVVRVDADCEVSGCRVIGEAAAARQNLSRELVEWHVLRHGRANPFAKREDGWFA